MHLKAIDKIIPKASSLRRQCSRLLQKLNEYESEPEAEQSPRLSATIEPTPHWPIRIKTEPQELATPEMTPHMPPEWPVKTEAECPGAEEAENEMREAVAEEKTPLWPVPIEAACQEGAKTAAHKVRKEYVNRDASEAMEVREHTPWKSNCKPGRLSATGHNTTMEAAGQRMLKYVCDGNAGQPTREELFDIRRGPEVAELQYMNENKTLKMTWKMSSVKGILDADTESESDSDIDLIESVTASKPHFAGEGFISQQANGLRSIETGQKLLQAKAKSKSKQEKKAAGKGENHSQAAMQAEAETEHEKAGKGKGKAKREAKSNKDVKRKAEAEHEEAGKSKAKREAKSNEDVKRRRKGNEAGGPGGPGGPEGPGEPEEPEDPKKSVRDY